MPRAVAGRKGHRRRIVRGKQAALIIELPDEDRVQTQVDVQHEASGWIGLDHVGVGPIVAADGEAARRRMRRTGRADRARVHLHVRRVAEPAVGEDREHGHRAAEVVGDQQVTSGRMHADIGGPGAPGTHRVEKRQGAVGPIDREGTDGALLVVADPIGLVGGIEPGSRGVEHEAAWARAHLHDAARRECTGGAVDPEEVNAAAVPGRQIHLGRQRIAQRES